MKILAVVLLGMNLLHLSNSFLKSSGYWNDGRRNNVGSVFESTTSNSADEEGSYRTFASLGLSYDLQQAAVRSNWSSPTEVQQITIPAILRGRRDL